MSEPRTFTVPSERAVVTNRRLNETFVEGWCDGSYFQMSFEKRSDGKVHIHFYALTDEVKVRVPKGHEG
jgi:hypothetical protein